MEPSAPQPSSSQAQTRDRILDSAELLFADQGYRATSLRQITEAAAANLAAVNYHFGSKEDLYRDIFLRRIRPINELRMRQLDEAEQLAGDHPVPVRHLLDIIFRPVMAAVTGAASGTVHPIMRIMLRNLVEPPLFMVPVVQAELGPLLQRLAPPLKQNLPHLTPELLLWRLRFIMGAALITFTKMPFIEQRLVDLGARTDTDTMLQQLIIFAEAGLSAPAPA